MKHATERYLDSDIIIVILLLFTERRYILLTKKLAQEVATHPGVILWHISNEYGGECHCPLCQEAFRNWLKEKYQTIENLNG